MNSQIENLKQHLKQLQDELLDLCSGDDYNQEMANSLGEQIQRLKNEIEDQQPIPVPELV